MAKLKRSDLVGVDTGSCAVLHDVHNEEKLLADMCEIAIRTTVRDADDGNLESYFKFYWQNRSKAMKIADKHGCGFRDI